MAQPTRAVVFPAGKYRADEIPALMSMLTLGMSVCKDHDWREPIGKTLDAKVEVDGSITCALVDLEGKPLQVPFELGSAPRQRPQSQART